MPIGLLRLDLVQPIPVLVHIVRIIHYKAKLNADEPPPVRVKLNYPGIG